MMSEDPGSPSEGMLKQGASCMPVRAKPLTSCSASPFHTDLELTGISRTAAHCKGICHMVAEGAIVRVLLDSHQLHGCITILLDAW